MKSKLPPINNSKGGQNPPPTNPRPAPPEAQKSLFKYDPKGNPTFMTLDVFRLISKIEEEASGPPNVSYEYDPTPTAEERLRKILKMISDFKTLR